MTRRSRNNTGINLAFPEFHSNSGIYFLSLHSLAGSTDVNEKSFLFRAKWKERMEQGKTGYVGTVFVQVLLLRFCTQVLYYCLAGSAQENLVSQILIRCPECGATLYLCGTALK